MPPASPIVCRSRMTALLILMPLPIDAVAQNTRRPGRSPGSRPARLLARPGTRCGRRVVRSPARRRDTATCSTGPPSHSGWAAPSSQHLRLGGEVLSWINQNGPAVESLSSALFVAQFYPVASTGFYLKGGLGIGRNAVDFEDGYDIGDTGFAGLVGAGYELRLGRRLYLNPVIDFVGHRYDDGFGGSYRERLVNFGLGILLQTGR